MSDLSVKDLKALLGDRIEDLAAQLAPAGKRQGRVWVAFSPLRSDNTKTEAFNIWLEGGARGAWKDYGSGEQGDVIDLIAACACAANFPFSREKRGEALAWARDYLGLTNARPAEAKARAVEARERSAERDRVAAADRHRRQRRAFDLWLSGSQMRDTIGDAYLKSRGIDARAIPNLEASLRFKERLDHPFEPHAGPAMLAKFTSADGGFAAVHCTYLHPDGTRKAEVHKQKIIRGDFAGASIRLTRGMSELSPEDAGAKSLPGLVAITEGIEDGLTIAQARPEWRIWAAGSLDNIGNQPALACVSSWLVCADNDLKKAAQEALDRGLAKLARAGKPIDVARAIAGKDFNDLLRGAA